MAAAVAAAATGAAEAAVAKTEILAIDNSKIEKAVTKAVDSSLREAYKETDKQARTAKVNAAKKEALEALEDLGAQDSEVSVAFKHLQQHTVRRQIVETGQRIDGRGASDVRAIESEVAFLPRVHGSALFTRGETQVIAGTTLGSGSDEQMIDGLEGDSKQGFMLHYNFPAYSVGEATPSRGPGRREIGHGKLAWRAIHQVLPTKAEFPYTIRVVSEVTESNGSSSMATVCGGILSLMDAGVPIKSPVAGIAMGLILEKDKYVVLSDILGDEDHLGDMDFKVAGTKDGITALQMDIKVKGISSEIMQVALTQAKEGRMHILGKMQEALDTPRTSVNEYAPSIVKIKINKDKIRELIGPGGKVIKGICEETKAKIDIDDNGIVTIASMGLESGQKALKMVEEITMEPEVNKIYHGKVVKIMEFGAFVNISSGKDGFLHISELLNEKVANINDVLTENAMVYVKVIGFDQRGKVKLSMKVVNQETGEDLGGNVTPSPKTDNKPAPRGPKPPHSGNKRHNSSPKKEPEQPQAEKRKYFT